MKRLFLFTALAFSTAVMAQDDDVDAAFISQGNFELTGSFFLNFDDSESNNSINRNSFSIGIIPQIGYAINDDLVLGLGTGFTYSEGESENESRTDEFEGYSYTIAPYIKKYFSLTETFALDIQGELSYSYSEQEGLLDLSSDRFFIGLRPAVNYKINRNLALRAQIGSLGYSLLENKVRGQEIFSRNNFGLSLNAEDVNFGLTYFF
jgi:opacity protein-like surface antigen